MKVTVRVTVRGTVKGTVKGTVRFAHHNALLTALPREWRCEVVWEARGERHVGAHAHMRDAMD